MPECFNGVLFAWSIKIENRSQLCLFAFDCLVQFSDLKLQPFYFSADAGPLHHYPCENAHEAHPCVTTDKDGCIHNLISGLVGLKEFKGTKNHQDQTDGIHYKNIEHNPKHLFAVHISYI
jgi:hypothetical protein